MIRISPYTPLFFSPSDDTTAKKSSYVQIFSRTDKIVIELLADTTDVVPCLSVFNAVTGSREDLSLKEWKMNSVDVLYYYILTQLPVGCYYISVNGVESELFEISEDEKVLEKTVLVQYSNKSNSSTREAVFFIDNAQLFFDFRIPGGFKDSEWFFECDSNQFTTSDGDIVVIDAKSSTMKTLTIGTSIGCPIWFGEHFNRLLCCELVYVNGKRYSRKESKAPDITEVIENGRSYVFKQQLQEVCFLDNSIESVNKMQFRSVDENIRSSDSDNLRKC